MSYFRGRYGKLKRGRGERKIFINPLTARCAGLVVLLKEYKSYVERNIFLECRIY